MKILEKIVNRQNYKYNPGVTIAFYGDSVTQGCFEIYMDNGDIETVFDKSSAYHKYFAEIFEHICPEVPFNIINAGISGATAPSALKHIDNLVLKNNPDLTVVCFGLNDSTDGKENVGAYIDALSEIFDKLKENGSEIIFMTPNMMCTQVSPHITDPVIARAAKKFAEQQLDGYLDFYMEAALKLCEEKGIVVCDCYKKWKAMYAAGINITELLSNKINHPTREMNRLFAYSLAHTIFE